MYSIFQKRKKKRWTFFSYDFDFGQKMDDLVIIRFSMFCGCDNKRMRTDRSLVELRLKQAKIKQTSTRTHIQSDKHRHANRTHFTLLCVHNVNDNAKLFITHTLAGYIISWHLFPRSSVSYICVAYFWLWYWLNFHNINVTNKHFTFYEFFCHITKSVYTSQESKPLKDSLLMKKKLIEKNYTHVKNRSIFSTSF